MIKKINGYRIFMNKKIGKGAYGIVILNLFRCIKESRRTANYHVLSKCSTNRTVTIGINLVNSDPYLKAALISEIKIMKELKN